MASQAPKINQEQIECFVHDQLKSDLRLYEQRLMQANVEITEYIELQKSIEQMQKLAEKKKPLKTRMNVGCDMYVAARVDDLSYIYLDVGLKHFVQFTLAEALRYIAAKLAQLNASADELREESIKVRAYIKLALMTIGEDVGVNVPEKT